MNLLDEILFYFVELPKFWKGLEKLENDAERWVYFLKHAGSLEVVPPQLDRPPFEDAFATLRRSNLTPEELELYEKYWIAKQDEIGAIRAAERRGQIQSKQQAILQVLEARFGVVPQPLQQIQALTELEKLDSLLALAASYPSLQAFREAAGQ